MLMPRSRNYYYKAVEFYDREVNEYRWHVFCKWRWWGCYKLYFSHLTKQEVQDQILTDIRMKQAIFPAITFHVKVCFYK